MIVNSIRREDLLKQNPDLTDNDIIEIQAFGVFLRRSGAAPAPGEKRILDRLGFAYATNRITGREYLAGVAVDQLLSRGVRVTEGS